MEELTKYIPIAIAIGALIDSLAGFIPDKWVPYIGVVRRVVRRVLGISKPKE